jgi:hypothetical protein
MENSITNKHNQSINKILDNIKGLKLTIRDSYKKIKCNTEKEQEILYQNL